MYKDPLEVRRKALEEAFFKKENERLLTELRGKQERDDAVGELARACGFKAEPVQNALVALGVSSSTYPALALVPLIAVAWADGRVTTDERKTILEAAERAGLDGGSPGQQILDSWLESPPPADLFEAWLELTRVVTSRGPAEQHEILRDDILSRARRVAKASGGVAGIGSISSKEQAVLDIIESVF